MLILYYGSSILVISPLYSILCCSVYFAGALPHMIIPYGISIASSTTRRCDHTSYNKWDVITRQKLNS